MLRRLEQLQRWDLGGPKGEEKFRRPPEPFPSPDRMGWGLSPERFAARDARKIEHLLGRLAVFAVLVLSGIKTHRLHLASSERGTRVPDGLLPFPTGGCCN